MKHGEFVVVVAVAVVVLLVNMYVSKYACVYVYGACVLLVHTYLANCHLQWGKVTCALRI